MSQPHLESDLMRGFLAVAESGSVTLAAARIGRTQSAVSLLIRRLEDSLGQPLFQRLARRVSLTARGEQLLPYAQRVVALLDEAALALREKPLTGPVRVGIPDEYSGSILPRALAAFDERHEGLQVSVLCDHSERQLLALEEDRLVLSVNAPDAGAADEELPVGYGDEPLEIGFNAKYLHEIASQIERENAVFLFNGSGDAALIREGGDTSAVYVVMPMRV